MKQSNITKWWCGLLGVITFIVASMPNAHAGRGIYGVSEYADPGPFYQGKARDSRCNSLFLFTLKVYSGGSINYGSDATPLCKNGSYIGNSVWDQQLNGCRGGSISRIEMCIGEWGSSAFDSIRTRINSDGTGSGTILFRNFNALKNKIRLDAFQMDDEKTYDRSTMVRFCKMLKDGMGVWVSLCPYTNQSFWAGVKSDLPDRVTDVWLQCYDGGAGNSATNWRSALSNTSLIRPGATIFDGPTKATQRYRDWRNQGFTGAFIWSDKRVPDSQWGQWMINGGF